jgi:hypothetical protein
VVLAVAGYCLFIIRRLDGRNLIVPLSGLVFSAMFLYRICAVPELVYSMRRFVPVAVPVALVMIACLAVDAGKMVRGRYRPVLKTAAAVLVLALLVWSCVLSVRVFKISQTRASLGVVHQVSDIASEPGIIVCDQRGTHLLAAPLRNFFGREVAGIRRKQFLQLPGFFKYLNSLKGQVVYFVSSTEDVGWLAKRFPMEKLGTAVFGGTMLKPTVEKPAIETGSYTFELYVYRVTI